MGNHYFYETNSHEDQLSVHCALDSIASWWQRWHMSLKYDKSSERHPQEDTTFIQLCTVYARYGHIVEAQ